MFKFYEYNPSALTSSGYRLRIFVLIAVFIGGLGQGLVNPKMPEILSDHSRLALDSGISASLMYLGIFAASFLYGSWSDRGHTFRLLAVGLLGYALVLIAFCFTRSKDGVFALRFFEGLSLSAIYVAADVVLCRASSDQERGQWLSYYGIALSLGLLLGPLMLLCTEFLNLGQGLNSSLYLVSAVAVLCFAYTFRFSLPRPEHGGDTEIQNKTPALAAVLYGFLEAGLVAVLAAIVVQFFKSKVEWIFTLIILSAVLASIAWGTCIDKFGGRSTLKIVFLIFSSAMALVTFTQIIHPTEVSLLASAVAFGTAAGGIYPAGFAWLIEGSPPAKYGYASGLFTRAYGLGSLFGPLIFGLAAESAGSLGFFSVAAFVGFAGFIFVTRSAKSKGAL